MPTKQDAVSFVTLTHKGRVRIFLGDLDIGASLVSYTISASVQDATRITLELFVNSDPDEETRLRIAEKLLNE